MKDKKYLLLTSLIILLPCVAGLLLWNRLPQEIVTHFGPTGNPDGWSAKPFAVFGVPLILLAVHWLCVWVSRFDRRGWEHNEKLMKIIFWVFPVMSVVMGAVTYSIALGQQWNISRIMLIGMGVLFVAMGNYLPKCRRNATLGIKLYWTLHNEENWNKTHRFGGKCWVAAGLGFLLLSFLPIGFGFVSVGLMLIMVLLPMGYSWLLYRKQLRLGTWTKSDPEDWQSPAMQRMKKLSGVAICCILVIVVAILFTGEIRVDCQEEYLTVNASYSEDTTVYYDAVKSVEYRPEGVEGVREWGFGSPRLLLGLFRNDEFGQYIRYTYTGDTGCVIVHLDSWVLVLSGKTPAETERIANEISDRVMARNP